MYVLADKMLSMLKETVTASLTRRGGRKRSIRPNRSMQLEDVAASPACTECHWPRLEEDSKQMDVVVLKEGI
jgi:hypothetical protein